MRKLTEKQVAEREQFVKETEDAKPSDVVDVSRVCPSDVVDVSRVCPSDIVDVSRVCPSDVVDVGRVQLMCFNIRSLTIDIWSPNSSFSYHHLLCHAHLSTWSP